ncbi:MAG: hypothetical protein EZS28_002743 [Streblomastix strix]|uniref:Protein kinase domain-containing protein n=1 Tax=Streblomastix strix TaxID=222440 RepID=A0A5J4X4S5_9EUKA|nr:MAG: hypothetical protein EZS28_002743 [Streblomastix strix]
MIQQKYGLSALTQQQKEELFKEDIDIIQNQLHLKNPQKISAGNWGRVYSAQDTDSSYVAVKVQKQEEYYDEEFAAAGNLNTIASQYFVKTFGKKEMHQLSRVFIAMELANLGSFEQVTDRGKIVSENVLTTIAYCLLEFLSKFHAMNLVHWYIF